MIEPEPRPVPEVSLRRRLGWPLAGIVVLALCLALWAAQHALTLISAFNHANSDQQVATYVVLGITSAYLLFQVTLAWIEPIHRVTGDQRAKVDALRVTVNVPVYNEEPQYLTPALMSLLNQSRPPDRIQIVDDGSTINYDDVRDQFLAAARDAGVDASWVRQPNGGKRKAQAATFTDDDGDIFVTVDSDTLLAREAIEEGLKPFADDRVTSVAGLILGLNSQANLMTRMSDLICTAWQLQGRSANSTMGGVVVNSGAFALYRGWVFRKYLRPYLNETFFGREVRISDDAYMTMFSLLEGRTVQQPTAIALTQCPERFSVYCRQYTRWMRGSFIRTFWRLRYLRATSYPFWMQVYAMGQFVVGWIMVIAVYFYYPLVNSEMLPYTAVVPFLLGYVITPRYLLVVRSDVSTRSLWANYALAPAMILWGWFVLRPIRFYAACTFLNTGWVTRNVEESVVDDEATHTVTV